MGQVDIGRLRLRGPPHLAARTAFLIEDACRTELPDGERLVLVRRLDLGRGAGRGTGQAAALRHAYDQATLGARHGGDEAAAGANCVWFASRAEARRLLLAALLAGREPGAWYWRLAVPDWRGRPLKPWLGALLAAALDADGEPGLLDIVSLAVEAGAAETLLNLLAESAGIAGAPRSDRGSKALEAASVPLAGGTVDGDGPDRTELDSALLRLREHVPAVFAERVENLVRRIGPRSRPAAKLLERLLLTASPSLAVSAPLLRELAEAYAARIAGPPAVGRRGPAESPPRTARTAARPPGSHIEAHFRPRTPAAAVDPAAAARPATPGSADPEAEVAPAEAPAIIAEAPLLFAEVRSPAAGLWLTIPSLIRMGLREWLAERPEHLCDDAGRTLVRAIARHHRVAAGDATLMALPADEEETPEWARLWRVGLDRWLRRRARIPLARLVWRPGWIRLSEERLVVRFATGDADLRLRRRALDVDPGWTDWLGLSVRYAFADRPAP